MSAPPASPQDTQAVVAVLLFIGTALFAASRVVRRVVLLALIVLVIWGTVVGFDTLRSIMTSHHS
jgi:hypothetical protein